MAFARKKEYKDLPATLDSNFSTASSLEFSTNFSFNESQIHE